MCKGLWWFLRKGCLLKSCMISSFVSFFSVFSPFTLKIGGKNVSISPSSPPFSPPFWLPTWNINGSDHRKSLNGQVICTPPGQVKVWAAALLPMDLPVVGFLSCLLSWERKVPSAGFPAASQLSLHQAS